MGVAQCLLNSSLKGVAQILFRTRHIAQDPALVTENRLAPGLLIKRRTGWLFRAKLMLGATA